MNNQRLLIYEFNELAEILKELNDIVKFEIIEFNQANLSSLELFNDNNYLILTQNEQPNLKNQYILDKIPIKIFRLIEKINTEFLKQQFSQQSEIDIGKYKINLNSRELFSKIDKLKLTEKEVNIILYLFNFKKPVKVSILQSEVWGYQSQLETHTVETHIYRLRKKIFNTFKDNDFITSTQNGYKIN